MTFWLNLYEDGIHLTVAHRREWSYGFKPDNKTAPLPYYLESPYDHLRESRTSQAQPAKLLFRIVDHWRKGTQSSLCDLISRQTKQATPKGLS